MGLILCPVSVKEANLFVKRHHRHHLPTTNHLFAVGVAPSGSDQICGVAIVSRPLSRVLSDGWTAEVVRCCTDGSPNACSMLYGASWRACRALGYRRLITYTLADEGGASLRGAGWKVVGESKGGTWYTPSRPRVDKHPTQRKLRWEVT